MTEDELAAIEAWAQVNLGNRSPQLSIAAQHATTLVAEVRRLQARLADYETHCFMDCVNY